MDSKRKANGTAVQEPDDRLSKRRKVADFDLSKGETPESTSAYGLSFLQQIRRTADKHGREVAGYFETLIPRQGNAEYYKRTQMPISLEMVEQKLENGEFQNLAELESYLKRMIANAKEFYPRSSAVFDDAERVRKAVSNYMTKTNPAYNDKTYQAVPTPLPADGNGGNGYGGRPTRASNGQGTPDEEDDGAEEDGAADQEEEEEGRGSGRRSIVLKRRGPSRSSRHSISTPQESPMTPVASAKPDHQYEGIPYKGLTFQQAQEKIVEELIRHQEPEYDDAYFEPFINLPPRALKDYYRIVTDPLSLKKLQKSVKGVHGRNDASGVSDFKSWNAFEEKSKLLWTNAYFYNEEGSEIYALAQELETAFYDQLKQAQAVVQEPAQPPKIKLKVGQAVDAPSSSKKITIHVGGRGGSGDSPAPQTQIADVTPQAPVNGVARGSGVQPSHVQLDKTRSGSAAAMSPSPSMMDIPHVDARVSPANVGRPPSATPMQLFSEMGRPPMPHVPMQPTQPMQNHALVNGSSEKRLRRAEGKGVGDALISKLRISTHVAGQQEPSSVLVLPDAREMHQSAAVNVPASSPRICVFVTLPEFLRDRQYNLWVLLEKQPLKPTPQTMSTQEAGERPFDMMLHPGLNVLEAHAVAAIPSSERVAGEAEVEVEIFTVYLNVLRS